jgi:hypothetical protein
MTRTRALLVCLALFAACGGGDDDATPAGGPDAAVAGADAAPPLALADFLSAEKAARCAKLFECCTPTELTGTGFDSEASCREALATFDPIIEELVDQHVAAGTAVYDGAAAGACVAQLAGLDCAAVPAVRFALATPQQLYCLPFEGQLADDAPCQDALECASGNCAPEDTPGAGTCQPKPGEGEPCRGNCGGGLRCVGDTALVPGTCQPHAADGEACETSVDCLATSSCVLPAGRCEHEDAPVCDGPG